MCLNEENEIFEVQPLEFSPNSSSLCNCFITRQRNLISIQHLKGNAELKTLSQFRTKSTPFISFAQSTDINSLVLTTLKQHIRIYDLNCSPPKIVQLYEMPNLETRYSWNTIKAWKEHTYLYGNERELKIVDVRTQPDQWMNSLKLNTDSLQKCDHISSLKASSFSNLVYVATNHKLHCLDVRQIKSSSLDKAEGAICRWTHQLEFAPLMMDTYRLSGNEYIALSSAMSGDLHLCQLSRRKNIEKMELLPSHRIPKHIYQSHCLPYKPPTLSEAFEIARVKGTCLQPESNIAARIKCCTTGLTFCNPWNDESPASGLLLYSNSIGDVHAYTFVKREMKETERCSKDQVVSAMSVFEKRIRSSLQPELNYTEIKNMLCKYLFFNILLQIPYFCLNEYSQPHSGKISFNFIYCKNR